MQLIEYRIHTVVEQLNRGYDTAEDTYRDYDTSVEYVLLNI